MRSSTSSLNIFFILSKQAISPSKKTLRLLGEKYAIKSIASTILVHSNFNALFVLQFDTMYYTFVWKLFEYALHSGPMTCLYITNIAHAINFTAYFWWSRIENSWRSHACNECLHSVHRIHSYSGTLVCTTRHATLKLLYVRTQHTYNVFASNSFVRLSLSFSSFNARITSRSLWLRSEYWHIRAKKVNDWIRWILNGKRWTHRV